MPSFIFLFFFLLSEKPGSPTIAQSDIQATSLTVKWTVPADNGGSPITAYRVVILKDGANIKNFNITDPGTTSWNAGRSGEKYHVHCKCVSEECCF